MAKMAFHAAAKAQVEDEELEEQEPWFEFSLLDQDFVVRNKPSTAQSAVLLAGMADGSAEFYAGVLNYLEAVVENGRGRIIRRFLSANQITWGLVWGGDDQNEKGIVDTIIGLASANPTGGRSVSSSSPPATGKRSTGRSPGKGSTLSET